MILAKLPLCQSRRRVMLLTAADLQATSQMQKWVGLRQDRFTRRLFLYQMAPRGDVLAAARDTFGDLRGSAHQRCATVTSHLTKALFEHGCSSPAASATQLRTCSLQVPLCSRG
eukprot:gene20817-24950_t